MDVQVIYVGLPLKAAEIMAARLDHTVRITSVDGKACVGTRDVVMNRINLKVENNVVVVAHLG